jgi:hypothetical protein
MFRDSNREIAKRRAGPTLRFADGRTDAPIGSRPGFVIDAASQEIRDRAYRESIEAMQNAWRGAAVDVTPSPVDAPMPVADAIGADLKTLMARLEDARHRAYAEYCRELQDGWRR